ncbi:c-type cytochrome [Spartinivicinus poritis]|uniref:C-type cytochrome n=1 Tax=Spartinivicinus poritis TaxID=2994640 RepID=A0ABT5UE98_9GAMM|nr:c-type cytochrome [Spartinivicinus sp. A2-2]MDE1463842.1 c-type cytochrome [Spartinivicinus sp. A2-2]
MIVKPILVLVTATVLSKTALAIDVSPYQYHQQLTDAQATDLKKRYKNRLIQSWYVNDPNTIDSHSNSQLIRYGIKVLDKTAETIGPNVSTIEKRFSGNNLNCSNCHLKGPSGLPGTKYYGIPFVNVMNDYPNFRARSMMIGTAADRVNGCMTRSMGDGKKLPENSLEMRGILAYFNWLAEGTKLNQAMVGVGLPHLKLPNRKVNVKSGQRVYQSQCAVCHGPHGLGTKAAGLNSGYLFPPIAGNDSYNNGAGMSRVIKASRFIYANMPFGATAQSPIL